MLMLGAALLASPGVLGAPTARRPARIGLLHVIPPETSPGFAAFRQALAARGYAEGGDVVLDYRWSAEPDRLLVLAAELAAQPVDVMMVGDAETAAAVLQVTTQVPLVAAVLIEDPMVLSHVKSLARPGGNFTALSLVTPEATRRRLELLHEIIPDLRRIGVLWSPRAASHGALLRETEVQAKALGLAIYPVEANDAEDIGRAFRQLVEARVGAVDELMSAQFFHLRAVIAELALEHRLPLVSSNEGFVQLGGLLRYGANPVESWREAADYIDRILRGAHPGDLPIELAKKFVLAINLKTAATLGLTVPPTLLARADEVVR